MPYITKQYKSLDSIIKNQQLSSIDLDGSTSVELGDIEFRAPLYEPSKIC